ncbi:MAG: DUF2079 domain-containing protein [Candidatus Eremiobacteraeota bacterium]|nr:DUF2079 domain-containing protein [Candidatus Eremiobacteraeota bacterium]
MSAVAAYRWHIWSYGADTGTFTQSASNGLHGLQNTSELGSHLHVHWSPILVTLYPFESLTHSGLSIQILQVVLIGVAIFPFFAFLRRYLADRTAATCATLALIYPPLLAVAFDEFHEIAFYPALVFALLWSIDARKHAWTVAFAAVLLLVREEALLVLAIFGATLALATAQPSKGTPRGVLFFEPPDPAFARFFGAAFALAAIAGFAFYFAIVAPALGGWTASHFYVYSFARGPRDVVAAVFSRPLDVVKAIVTPGRATYVLEAFAPLLFLGLRSRWMIVTLPALAIVVLSSDAIAWRMGSHYAAIWIPWLLVATAETIAKIARARDSTTIASRLSVAIVACCAVVLIAFDPLHPIHYLRAPYADQDDARRAFAAVPLTASVYTHDEWYAHVAGERPASEHIWNEPDYVVLAGDFPHAETFAPFMRVELERNCYAVVRRYGAVVVYRRTARAIASPNCRISR